LWAGEAILNLKSIRNCQDIELAYIVPSEESYSQWDDNNIARLKQVFTVCSEKRLAGNRNDRKSYIKGYFSMVDQSQSIIAVCRGDRDRHSDAESDNTKGGRNGRL
jgi:uncharacterized phage-like protein YoqJ